MQSRACCAPPNASTPPPTGLAGWGAGADSMELCAQRLQGHTASPQCRTLGDRLRHTLAAQVGDPRGASAALAVALQCVHAGGRREVCSPAPASSRRAAHLQGAIDAYRVQHRLAPARRHSLGSRVAPAVASALAAHYYRAGSLSSPHATPCKARGPIHQELQHSCPRLPLCLPTHSSASTHRATAVPCSSRSLPQPADHQAHHAGATPAARQQQSATAVTARERCET